LVGTGATDPKDALYFEKEARGGNLKKIIGSIAEGYDYAIIDSPAGMGSIAAVLLAMSNSVLIPINCRTLAIKTLPSSLNLTKQIRAKLKPDLRLEGVLITMLDDQNAFELKIREELKASFPEAAFFETIIPFDGYFETSNASAVPVAMIPEAKEAARSYMDLALAIQEVTEEIILRLARTTNDLTGCNNLVVAGGVALNCVANGKLLRENIYENIWIQPAAGDAGGALGAAYATRYIWQAQDRTGNNRSTDAMQGAYLGPAFDDRDVQRLCIKFEASYRHYENFGKLCKDTAALLADGNIVGWFQGRMELGPRALGNRSILGDPRHPEMQRRLNIKIKYREGFRPFAPSVLAEDAEKYFQLDQSSVLSLRTVYL